MAALGAGTVLSSARDMAKWALSLEKGTLLKPESWKTVFEQVKLSSGRPYPYGFGWFLDTWGSHPFIHHGGNTLGQSADIAQFPDEKVWVVALTNVSGQSYDGLAARIAMYLAPELKVKPRVETKDPDKERSYRLIDAMNAFANQKANAELMEDEMTSLLQTIRGKATAAGLRAGLGKLRSLRFVSEVSEGTDTWVSYVAHFEKRNLNLDLLVSKDRKLVRFRVVP
jgi:CubicO group peptidase (beta-lactamase class C family)